MLLSLILPVYVTRVRCHAGRRHANSNETPAQAELRSPSTLGFKPSHLFWTPMGASSVPHTHAEDELARRSSETLCHSHLPGAHSKRWRRRGVSHPRWLCWQWLAVGRLVALQGFGGPLALLSCGSGHLPPVTGQGPCFEAQVG